MEAEHLKLSKVKKVELFDFMKETRNKEEYRRASAIKQKLEGLPYMTIARNLDTVTAVDAHVHTHTRPPKMCLWIYMEHN